MKIIFVSPGHPFFDKYPGGGGTQVQIFGLAKELSRKGKEVSIIHRSHKKYIKIIDGVRLIGITAPFNDDVVSVLYFSKKAARLVKKEKPDILNLNEKFSASFPSMTNSRKFYFTHCYDAFKFYKKFSEGYRRINKIFFPIKRLLERKIMERCDRIIALNNSLKKYMVSEGFDHIEVIPNAVEIKNYKKKPEKNFILYAGRMNKVKGLDVLITAFDNIKGDMKLKMIGEGPYLNELKKIASSCKKSDNIEFLPWMKKQDMIINLSNCSFFVLPSYFECMPVVLLEAMASGKPCIASNIMGARDIINHGKNGLLFKPGDDKRLSDLMEEMARNKSLREKIGDNARRTIEKDYSFSSTSEKLMNVYSSFSLGQN